MASTDQESRDEVLGAVVAVLRALEHGDVDGADAVMATVDPSALAGFLLGLVGQLGPVAFGSAERFSAALAAWRPGQRLGDDLGDVR
ncbi:hypothetical protein ABZ949_05325 [Micromonospora tulbaghiae]|uniref:hypothetical protein n=1 Tax=Micromonospora tulbaghiae TaxID=479978 RepID=UPI0033C17DDF